MATWNVLFAVSIEHQYFTSKVCPNLRFEPDGDSERLMRNCGLMLRNTADGVQIIFEKDREEALRLQAQSAEGLDLVFKAYTDDQNYLNYSRPFDEATDGGLLYLENADAAPEGRVSKGEMVGNEDILPMDAAQLNGLLHKRERLFPPLFVLRLSAGEGGAALEQWLGEGLSRYQITFAAREVYWKYYLFGRMASENVYIHDPDGGVEFEPLGQVEFPGQDKSYAFRSRQRIPRSERYAYRFQLMKRSAGGDRDLLIMNSLPVAGIRQMGKEVIGGESVVVSEIYINS